MICLNWRDRHRVASYFRKYLPFREARAFARGLGLKSQREWDAFCKGQMLRVGRLPARIPATPRTVYANRGWKSVGDWLGTGAVANQLRKYRPSRKARVFVRKLRLKSGTEWRTYCKGEIPRLGRLPADIPVIAERTYAGKGWNGMGDWLGTGAVAPTRRKFRPFAEARAFARKLKLKGEADWRAFCKGKLPHKGKRPMDIPAHPERKYGDSGWVSWGDWLGTGTIASSCREFSPFREARAFVRKLNLQSEAQWRAYCKEELPRKARLPEDIPAHADRTYAVRGWVSWGDWLGTDRKVPSNTQGE